MRWRRRASAGRSAPSRFASPRRVLDAFARELSGAAPRRSARLLRESDAGLARRVRVRAAEHERRFADRRSAEARRGVCQDFAHIYDRARRGRSVSRAAMSAAIYSTRRRPGSFRGRRHPCLGRGVPARSRLGRLRSDEQPDRRANATFGWRSGAITPTCRRRAASTRAPRRQERTGGCGARRPGHIAGDRRRSAVHAMDVTRRRRADLQSRARTTQQDQQQQ